MILLGTLAIGIDSTTRVSGDDGSTRNAAPECTGEGVYKPFNTWRKIQLAAAYFVDPASQEKARLGTVYSLESVISWKTENKIIEEVKDKTITLMVPLAGENNDSFSAVDSECLFEYTANITEEVTIKDLLHEHIKLFPETMKDPYVLVEERDIPNVDGITAGKPVIAWDPKSPVNLIDFAKSN